MLHCWICLASHSVLISVTRDEAGSLNSRRALRFWLLCLTVKGGSYILERELYLIVARNQSRVFLTALPLCFFFMNQNGCFDSENNLNVVSVLCFNEYAKRF